MSSSTFEAPGVWITADASPYRQAAQEMGVHVADGALMLGQAETSLLVSGPLVTHFRTLRRSIFSLV